MLTVQRLLQLNSHKMIMCWLMNITAFYLELVVTILKLCDSMVRPINHYNSDEYIILTACDMGYHYI